MPKDKREHSQGLELPPMDLNLIVGHIKTSQEVYPVTPELEFFLECLRKNDIDFLMEDEKHFTKEITQKQRNILKWKGHYDNVQNY